MIPDFDVIIIGSGPAGVSAAFPLVESGLLVLMVDGGTKATMPPPNNAFLAIRASDNDQWKWMIGEEFHALRKIDAASPKLRVPGLRYVFEGYAELNQIVSHNFLSVGSLATGGLSNAWGCGVACLSRYEMSDFPVNFEHFRQSYESIAKRMGISGCHDDDMADYFGLDAWAQRPVQMDALHSHMYQRYSIHNAKLASMGFRLGRSRVAALSEPYASRMACDLSGNCLWGCHRRSLYSALNDLTSLCKYENFRHVSGFVVEQLAQKEGYWSINGREGKHRDIRSISAHKLILAAGTLATTKLALGALKMQKPVRVLSNPTAAFLLWLPRFTGVARNNTFGLGQLSFNLKLPDETSVFGSTFSTTGIPISEFARHLPTGRRYGIDLLRNLLSSCVVGNLFLSGAYSASEAKLQNDGSLVISGGYKQQVTHTMNRLMKNLRKAYWMSGAILLPGSFKIGSPGSDIHYAGSLPMRISPRAGETSSNGELHGLPGIHVVDGSCLPTLSEKSHTLTLMANADRIGRIVSASSDFTHTTTKP